MNERMKQMAERCGLYGVKDYDNTISEDVSEHRLDKFAELIIAECVDIADDYVKDCTCDEHKNCKHRRSVIGRKIKQHFGV